MMNPPSLAEQLRLLLSLPGDTPFFATPSFQDWLPAGGQETWPPTAGGLWLIDTRDRVGKVRLSPWQRDDFDAALILTRSAPRRSLARRIAWRLRRRGAQRLPAGRIASELPTGDGRIVTELGFVDGWGTPIDFKVRSLKDTTGTAFLVTRTNPFSGPVWSTVHSGLQDPHFQVDGLQFRIRGAAVILGHSNGRGVIVRVAPTGRLQDLVRSNHDAIARVRAAVGTGGEHREGLLRLMPEALFEAEMDSALVLAETALPGVLAWKLAREPLAQNIYRETLDYLKALRQATVRTTALTADEIRDRIESDVRDILESPLGSLAFRKAAVSELRCAGNALVDTRMLPHVSHGDFGYGNILVNPESGKLTGVIDWDTARAMDFPGIDRVNLEIQIRRSVEREPFPAAVRNVWSLRTAHDALVGAGGPARVRALFRLAVCRYVHRSLNHASEFMAEYSDYREVLRWLRGGLSRGGG